jgi:hypothetical protein
VRIGRGRVNPAARGRFFKPNIPMAITCINISENIVDVCTVGQNSPPVSNFGT